MFANTNWNLSAKKVLCPSGARKYGSISTGSASPASGLRFTRGYIPPALPGRQIKAIDIVMEPGGIFFENLFCLLQHGGLLWRPIISFKIRASEAASY